MHVEMPECISSPWLYFHTCVTCCALRGPARKDHWAPSSLSRWERDLRVKWHRCLIHSPCAQLPFRSSAHVPDKCRHPHLLASLHPSLSEKCCSWPPWVSLPQPKLIPGWGLLWSLELEISLPALGLALGLNTFTCWFAERSCSALSGGDQRGCDRWGADTPRLLAIPGWAALDLLRVQLERLSLEHCPLQGLLS